MPLPVIDISNALPSNQKAVTDVIATMEELIHRNQSPTAKFKEIGGISSGTGQFGFLSSGQREEVQNVLFKIKSTGRKAPSECQIVLEDAELQDQSMTSLFSLKDQNHQALEHELRSQLVTFAKGLYPIFSKMKQSMIEQLLQDVRKSYKCFDEEVVKLLRTNLAFGGKDLTEEDFSKIIVDAAGAELSDKSNTALHSTVTIASDYLYEKMHEQLQSIYDDLQEEIVSEHRDKQEDEKRSSTAQKSPRGPTVSSIKLPTPGTAPKKEAVKATPTAAPVVVKKVPKPPPQKNKPLTKSEATSRASEDASIDELPKVESNLIHATKERPTVQSKRKPPTRKPRPAPPSSSMM